MSVEPGSVDAPGGTLCECGNLPEDDAAYCDRCGWPVARPRPAPMDARTAGALALASVLLAVVAVDWEGLVEGIASLTTRQSAPVEWLEQARREAIVYPLALSAAQGLDGHLVLWDVTPAGRGRAFHRGDPGRPIRLLNSLPWPFADISGKSAPSVRVLGRLHWDARPGVALQVVAAW